MATVSLSAPGGSSASLLHVGIEGWITLPETILFNELLTFVTFTDRRRFLATCSRFWKLRETMEHGMAECTLTHSEGVSLIRNQIFPETRFSYIFDGMANLVFLSLDNNCTDGFLHVALVRLGLFPSLRHLRMRSSDQVTDFGLDCVSRSLNAQNSLETIDITFCSNTTYGGTFCLRDRIPNLKLLRRQPEWLDGHFETPFVRDSGIHEVHTYYADGSFMFNRDSQSNGFVCELFSWQDDYLGDKLQYNNFRAPEMWPPGWQFAYRPGVCLMRLPPSCCPSNYGGSDDMVPTVLVGQYLQGLKAPRNRIRMEQAIPFVPMGELRYFDEEEGLLTSRPTAEGPSHAHTMMISRMRVRPLADDQFMPPPLLVQACRNTCTGMDSFGAEYLARQEQLLQQLISGLN